MLYQLVFTSRVGLAAGHSTTIHLHKNSIATPEFMLAKLDNTVSSVIISSISETFATTDSLIAQLNVNSGLGNANPHLATVSLY